MNKKFVVLLVCMLVICNGLLFSVHQTDVQASEGDGGEGDDGIGLDFTWVWKRVQNFSNVVHVAYDTDKGEIPKGRAWATAGEKYTRERILVPDLNDFFGAENVHNVSIGYINRGGYQDRKYSNKIVIKDYNLTICNNTGTHYLPYSEFFPLGIGEDRVLCDPGQLNDTYDFTNAEIAEPVVDSIFNCSYSDVYPFSGTYNGCFNNVTNISFMNNFQLTVGNVKYIEENDTIPTYQDGLVFLMNDSEWCEDKIDNISTGASCILLDDASLGYDYGQQQAATKYFPILKMSKTEENISSIIDELKNDTAFMVDNVFDNETCVFTYNLSYAPHESGESKVLLHKRLSPSQVSREYLERFNTGAYYYDFLEIIALQVFWRFIGNYLVPTPRVGFIISDSTNTHFMTHTVRDWGWFRESGGAFKNRYYLPTFSVNKSIGDSLLDNPETVVSGSIEQVYKCQTPTTPGVSSYNVVGYKNTSHSPEDKIVVVSNRIDGYWGETPGDSGAGGAIALGLAKYLSDYDITPRYNLTFLFTTGEEYGMRGAQHYNDSHPYDPETNENNFHYFIGFDQLAFNYTQSEHPLNLTIGVRNNTTRDIIWAIANQSNYTGRTEYGLAFEQSSDSGAEDYIWRHRCDTVGFAKDNTSIWDGYHRAGMNFSRGDSLYYTDRNDVDKTFEFAWNVTKYIAVDPDCWITNQTTTVIDSPDDGDDLPDIIQANFTLNSILPHDFVMVEVILQESFISGDMGWMSHEVIDYINITITKPTVDLQYNYTIPDSKHKANYSFTFNIYNSTGRINEQVGIGPNTDNIDDTYNGDTYTLYHPLGYTTVGNTSQNTEDRISGSVFTATADATAENITAHVFGGTFQPTPTYTCKLFRENDSLCIGTTEEKTVTSTGWTVFSFSDPKPSLQKGTEYVITVWGDNYGHVSYDTYTDARGRFTNMTYGMWIDPWSFTSENKLYSVYCGFTRETTPPEISNVTDLPDPTGIGQNVTISAEVTDSGSGVDVVLLDVLLPDETTQTVQMTPTTGDLYQNVFNSTWLVGRYTYSVEAYDSAQNSNCSTGHSFNVTGHATITVSTEQDYFENNTDINVTDPPLNPSKKLVDRGVMWDKYFDTSTYQYTLDIATGPINYLDQTQQWQPINTTITNSEHTISNRQYDYEMTKADYQVFYRASSSQSSDRPIMLLTDGYGISITPDNDLSYDDQTEINSKTETHAEVDTNKLTYSDQYGEDIHLRYLCRNVGVKSDLIIETYDTLPTPGNEHANLVFREILRPYEMEGNNEKRSMGVSYGKERMVFKDFDQWANKQIVTDEEIWFTDEQGDVVFYNPLMYAYDSDENEPPLLLSKSLHMTAKGELWVELLVPYDWLSDKNTTYPVYIDPTITTIYGNISDGYIMYTSGFGTYESNHDHQTGTVYDSSSVIYIGHGGRSAIPGGFRFYRGYVMFNTSMVPDDAVIDSANMTLYGYGIDNDRDFDIVVQSGQPTYPHMPLQSGDFYCGNYDGNGWGGHLNTTDFNASGPNVIEMNRTYWINKSGFTKLCLRNSREINYDPPSSGTPSWNYEYVKVYASENSSNQPCLSVVYSNRSQSKINNSGSTNTSGYLLIQVQYNDSGTWIVDNDTVNETTPRTINSSGELGLDTIFNGTIQTCDLVHGSGLYRVYACFCDPDGNVLVTKDEIALEACWEFEVNLD